MVLNWQTFLQWFIVPSYHIMITYPLWRCHFFWLTLQIRKRWAATVDHQYLHSGVKLVSCSFLKSFICISSCIDLVFRELDFQSRGPWFKIAGWLQGWLSTIPEISAVKSRTPSTKMGDKVFLWQISSNIKMYEKWGSYTIKKFFGY